MAWRFWQIGGYRCGNITRQAFDAARGLWKAPAPIPPPMHLGKQAIDFIRT